MVNMLDMQQIVVSKHVIYATHQLKYEKKCKLNSYLSITVLFFQLSPFIIVF